MNYSFKDDKRELEDLRHRLVTLTRELILIPGTVERPADINRAIEFVQYHIDLPGIVMRRYESAGWPSLVFLPEGINQPKAMLCGHIDVVALPHDANYRSQIEEGNIIGPGAGDMKGAVAILLEVFRDLHLRNPGISLGLVLTTDEELGGMHGIHYLLNEIGLRCDLALIPDSGSLTEITVEEKGILHLEVQAQGHAGHAARPWLSENALEKILNWYDQVRDFFEKFKNDDPQHWYPTCSLNVLQTPNIVTNRVPENAHAILDIRIPPPFKSSEILQQLEQNLSVGMKLKKIISAEPTQFDIDPLYIEITEKITGKTVEKIRAHGGSDARFFHVHGIPVFMSRPLVGNLHAEDEWVNIDSMIALFKIYEEYLEQKLG